MIEASPSADDSSTPAKSTPEAELKALYEQVDREVARYGPACQLSGRCCRFKEFAHTLFASTVEIRYLVAAAPEPSRPLDRGETCPWQDERGRCTARDARPLGCRIFYCDPAYQESAHEISERSIKELKKITQRWNLAWSYAPLHCHLARERDEGRLAIALAKASPQEQTTAEAVQQEPL